VAGFFSRLKGGLSKTRDNMVKGLDNVFSGYSDIDGDFYDDLEETLIMGDIGVNATSRILDKLRSQVEEKNIRSTRECRDLLIQNIREQMHTDEHAYDFENQKSVLFIIGVNGVGKTTSVGKLASIYKNKGKKVLVAAADTYRAAATEQLEEWANRAGVPLVKGVEGADPASVIFDAVNTAKAKDIDILIVDTAGRLHNKKNLMEELRKMNKILDNHLPEYKRENLIVLDGTTGQNAMSQAREFGEVTDLTGIILTKMDGTSKGGIAVAIVSELNIPVKYIGVGESLDDLERFEPQEFVDALFDIDHEERVKLDQEIVARKLSSGEMDSSQLTEEEAIDILTRH
jgi:fused signal recognition particle receptor